MPDKTPMILLDDVHLDLTSQAGQVNILRGVDLRIDEGETVGIIGPSGSGKSTLMMAIAGLERISSGRLWVGNNDISSWNERKLTRYRRGMIGIVFQSFHLIPTMTALENVALPLELAGEGDVLERARESLGAVGLLHRIDHYPGQMSGGEQQRVALARATIAHPRLLLADEPTGNLDGVTGRAIMELLFSLHESFKTTLVLITHDPVLADRCGRRVRIEDGRVVV